MGDRFYQQQKAAGRDKPRRRLKRDITDEITKSLGIELVSLKNCTIATLEELLNVLKTF